MKERLINDILTLSGAYHYIESQYRSKGGQYKINMRSDWLPTYRLLWSALGAVCCSVCIPAPASADGGDAASAQNAKPYPSWAVRPYDPNNTTANQDAQVSAQAMP